MNQQNSAPEQRSSAPELTDEELAFLDSAFDSARAGETGRLVELVEAGLPVNLTNARGDTLLILAAYHRHAETVRALLRLSADTARVNDMGQTALAAAVFRNDGEIVRCLLDADADPLLGAHTALEVAQHFDLPEMQALLHPISER